VEQSLEGKVVLVTGASSGIGEATALTLAKAGAHVAVGARRADRLADVARRASGEVLTLDLDVTDERSGRAAVAATVERFGGLDVLVNNAGLMLTGAIPGADTAEWTRMVQANLLGSMYMAHAALPHLLARKGTLVQVSSTSGRVASPGGGAYAATKFGINAFSEALRKEVAPQGMRVVVIEPGFTDTELASHSTDPRMQALARELASSIRVLQPEDIAAAVLYAVSQPAYVSVSELLISPTDYAA
jgi:NADP-dependent 3-hydroxy acid dehydrogenase YdfG